MRRVIEEAGVRLLFDQDGNAAGIARGEAWLGTRSPSAGAAAPGGIFSIADVYPLKQPSELAWVKTCLRMLELLDRVEGVADERVLDPLCHGIARRCWVHGQYMFFRRRGFEHNGVAEALETWAIILLMSTAFLLAPECKELEIGILKGMFGF